MASSAPKYFTSPTTPTISTAWAGSENGPVVVPNHTRLPIAPLYGPERDSCAGCGQGDERPYRGASRAKRGERRERPAKDIKELSKEPLAVLSPGQNRFAAVSFATATGGLPARSAGDSIRPASSGMPSVLK